MRKTALTFKIFLTTALFSILQVQARWATREDAAIVREFFNSEVTVHRNGTSSRIYEFQDLIVKDYARTYGVGFTLPYNANVQTITILSAKTILDGVEYEVLADKIEDKPLASSPLGFDQMHQILVSFPKIEVGARIYLKYKVDIEKVPVPGSFSEEYAFGVTPAPGMPTYWENAHVDVHSEIPLYFKVNDPTRTLKIKANERQPVHTISIDLTSPLVMASVNEPEGSILNPKHQCWVSVSSFKNWGQLAEKFSQDYAAVIDQPLPQKLKSILEEAKQKEGEVAQINEVTSLLNSQIQYMGDWKSIGGKFIPRPLQMVDKTGVGDCKDFTACTGAILKNMGYEVSPALVWRGDNPPAETILPTNSATNHVFLKIKGKSGRVYWVDPTNFVSMAQGIFPDVAGKMALVLDLKHPAYECVPEISPESSQMEADLEMTVKDRSTLEVSGVYVLRGESAFPLCGTGLNLSLQNIAEQLLYSLAETHLEPKKENHIELPDLQSRVVKDLEFKFSYERPNGISKSNVGVRLPLKTDSLDPLLKAVPDQANDLFVELPQKKITRRFIKNGPIVNIEKLNYSIKTPWVEVERVCSNAGTTSEITTTISFLTRYIPAEDLKSDAYKELKKSLEWNMKDVTLILDESRVS